MFLAPANEACRFRQSISHSKVSVDKSELDFGAEKVAKGSSPDQPQRIWKEKGLPIDVFANIPNYPTSVVSLNSNRVNRVVGPEKKLEILSTNDQDYGRQAT